MQIVNSLGRYQLVPLTFQQDAVAASQTAAALYVTEVHGPVVLENVGYTMPFPGEIVAISSNLSTAATVGSLVIVPTVNTTAKTAPAVTMTTLTYGSDSAKRSTLPFAKNAVIGAKITTSADWNGTGADLVVTVWVLLKISGI